MEHMGHGTQLRPISNPGIRFSHAIILQRPAGSLWEPLARLVLDAFYKVTFAVGAINAACGGSKKLFLTLLGRSAFGNDQEWILDAISQAVEKFRSIDPDVRIVSYGKSNPAVLNLVRQLNT